MLAGVLGSALRAMPAAATVGGSTAMTWDPANKSSHIALSGSDMIATSDGSPNSLVFATLAITGKKCFEVKLGTIGGQCLIGLGDLDNDAETGLAEDTNSVFYSTNNGAIGYNGSYDFGGTAVAGDYITIHIDELNKKVWFAVNDVDQNGDPAAGTGGKSCPAINAFYALFQANAGTASDATLRITSGSFQGTVRSGFAAVA